MNIVEADHLQRTDVIFAFLHGGPLRFSFQSTIGLTERSESGHGALCMAFEMGAMHAESIDMQLRTIFASIQAICSRMDDNKRTRTLKADEIQHVLLSLCYRTLNICDINNASHLSDIQAVYYKWHRCLLDDHIRDMWYSTDSAIRCY